jgi:hypothetical protein
MEITNPNCCGEEMECVPIDNFQNTPVECFGKDFYELFICNRCGCLLKWLMAKNGHVVIFYAHGSVKFVRKYENNPHFNWL